MSDEEENDCPLCLLPLEPYDGAHPLQCPSRHCNFNCCLRCLEQMIESTKDKKIEASDGNTFRVFLHCPNCRSNLGPSIRDTVLLRKVDKYSKQTHAGDGTEVADAELSASELRFRYALEKDEDVASAIQGAQHREDEFFGRDTEEADDTVDFPSVAGGGESLQGSFAKEDVWSFDDEEGVEADLLGPHKSFVFRHHSIEALNKLEDEPAELEDVLVDTTLLCGLEGFMTEQEQQYMTEELVSGDPQRIAAATEAMHYVSALSREGMRPSMNRQRSSMNIGKDKRGRLTKKSSMMESVRQIIREGSEARKREEEREARRAVGAVAAQLNGAPLLGGRVVDGRRNMHRMVELEIKKQIEYMKLHPLPLRMPKYAEVSSVSGLTFVDDLWDGTVLDAYAKITVKKSLLGNVTIAKQHAESMGIRRVIDAGSPASPRSDGRGIIDTVPRPRVLVASINRELGRQGVVKGDAVTHFNGQPFTGDASDLSALIGGKYGGEVLTFVVNADSAVAEALRRRAMIVDDNF